MAIAIAATAPQLGNPTGDQVSPQPMADAPHPSPINAAQQRSAKSRRIAWALAAVVVLLYALAFVLNR